MANPVLQCPAFAGPARPAFFFFCLSQLLSAASLRWRQNHFSLTWGWPLPPDSFTPPHTAPTRLVWGLRWCRSPTRCPKTHTGSHRGFFSFALSLLHFSPTGKAGLFPKLCCPSLRDSSTSGPHWPNGACLCFGCICPLPALKTAHRPSGGNLPPRKWVKSCGAASRFLQCHPMSTQ